MPERRETARYPLDKSCVLDIEGRPVKSRVENLSRKGALFRIMEPGDKAITNDDLGKEATFVLTTLTASTQYTGEIIRLYYADGAYHIAVRFWKEFPDPKT